MAVRKPKRSKPDPELLSQLDAADTSGKPVEAIVRLAWPPRQQLPPPEEFESMAQQVLGGVAGEIGVEPRRSHVFQHLGYVYVSADSPFIRGLIECKGVASVEANRAGGAAEAGTRTAATNPAGTAHERAGDRKTARALSAGHVR